MELIPTLFLTFIGLLIFSVPIAVSLGLASLLVILNFSPLSAESFTKAMIGGFDSFPLMAIPLFTFAGSIMGRGGVSRRLLDIAKLGFSKMTGGLGIVSIIACMFFAAISGTGSATVAAIGLIMIPEMVREGYHKPYATALVSTAGTIGTIIPPSICMIVYALAANVSITAMFTAGIPVGVAVGLGLCAYAFFSSRRAGFQVAGNAGEQPPGEAENQHILWRLFTSIPALLVPVIVLGGIYGGVFTPTEAAAIASFYGLIVSVFIYREVKLKELPYIAFHSCILSAPSLLIIGVSTGFGRILAITQTPAIISESIVSMFSDKIILLLAINLLLLIVGTFMETNAAIVILVPILLPIVQELGVDPVHFGMIMILNLAIGFITPPLGANLFMGCQISNMKFETLSKAIWPWILVMIGVLMIVTYVPQLSLFLPRLIGTLR